MASNSTTGKSNPLLAVRWRELRQLWQALLEREPFPQVDRWLSDEFRRNSKYGSRDRKWYAEMMFAAVRFGLLAVFLDEHGHEATDADILAFHARYPDLDSLQGAWRRMPADRFFVLVCLRHRSEIRSEDAALGEILDATIAQEPTLPGARARLDAFLARADDAAQTLKTAATPEDPRVLPALRLQLLKAGIPLWFAPLLVERWRASHWDGAQALAFIAMQNSRSPLWLRLNYEDKAPLVQGDLRKEDFDTVLVGKDALQATGAKGIFATESYRNGLFEIQDLASQGIGHAVGNQPGDSVWDCCAGGGGKTMQIASRAKNKGVVYASDVREYKLEEVKKRARRAGFFNIRCMPWQGAELPAFPKEIDRRGGFDWVLVDAPCSSSGTWRRNPDAKYRTLESGIETLGALQLQILTRASLAVRPGGHIVYSTCSWITGENEGLVERFLKDAPGFALEKQTLLGAPAQDADTMFVAVFVRQAVEG